MSDWYDCAGSGRNTTGATLTLFGEKCYLVGGAASNIKRKRDKNAAKTAATAVPAEESPWLQIDHMTLPTLDWHPVIVNSSGLLNRAYHASAGMATLDNRVFVFGGVYTSCPDEVAADVLEIETSSIFGVQVTLCEAASQHPATAVRGLSAVGAWLSLSVYIYIYVCVCVCVSLYIYILLLLTSCTYPCTRSCTRSCSAGLGRK